jgi:hypothetical protein
LLFSKLAGRQQKSSGFYGTGLLQMLGNATAAMSAAWREAKTVASILPKELLVKEQPPEEITLDDIAELLEAVRAGPPGENAGGATDEGEPGSEPE